MKNDVLSKRMLNFYYLLSKKWEEKIKLIFMLLFISNLGLTAQCPSGYLGCDVFGSTYAKFYPDAVQGEPCKQFFTHCAAYDPNADYTWDFGDGTVGSGHSVTHLYYNAGTYSVSHTFSGVINGITVVETCTEIVEISTNCALNLPQSNYCGTIGGGIDAIREITSKPTQTADGPFFIQLFIHAIRKPISAGGGGGVTDDSVQKMVDILNQDFNPHNIFFVWDCFINDINAETLASFQAPLDYVPYLCDPDHSTPVNENLFQNPNGINIFLGVPESDDPFVPDGIAENVPSNSMFIGGETDGVPSIETSYITHEMGHCLGLWHTWHRTHLNNLFGTVCGEFRNEVPDPWYSKCEFVNGVESNVRGDFVTDTEADPLTWSPYGFAADPCESVFYLTTHPYTPFSECPEEKHDSNGDLFLVDKNTGEAYTPPIHNFMSYSSTSCVNEFSEGQGERMRTIIATTPFLQATLVSPTTDEFISVNTTLTVNNTNNSYYLPQGNLIIEEGITLTVNAGVTIGFLEGTKLVVRPGAKLILRGTLTGLGCGDIKGIWDGVEVLNDNSSGGRGEFLGRSTGVVERAKVGVKLYQGTAGDISFSGGRISCIETTFKNNIIGVDIAPLTTSGNYPAVFRGTHFTIDQDYPHVEKFDSHIKMFGVQGVRVFGGKFDNNLTTGGDEADDWGFGINATDAGFSVTPRCLSNSFPCEEYEFTEFKDLGIGITTRMIATNQAFTVTKATFDNCLIGIRDVGVSNGIITLNDFKMGEPPIAESGPDVQIGIDFEDGITFFTCEENTFDNPLDNAQVLTFGIICNQTGLANKAIRRNVFSGVSSGNSAIHQNGTTSLSGTNPHSGVHYLCNQNINTLRDVFVGSNGIIRKGQGDLFFDDNGDPDYLAAGNQFYYTNPDFENYGMEEVDYYYDEFGFQEEPLIVFGLVTKEIKPNNGCEQTFCFPSPCSSSSFLLSSMKSDFYEAKSSFYSIEESISDGSSDAEQITLAYYKQQIDKNAQMILDYYLADSTGQDSVSVWVGNANNLESDLWLVRHFTRENKQKNALQILDEIPEKFDLIKEEKEDLNNYKTIVELLSAHDIYVLPKEIIEEVKALDNVGGYTEGWSRSILTYYGMYYAPEVEFPSLNGEKKLKSSFVKKETLRDQFSVYPNPSENTFMFSIGEYHEKYSDSKLVIRNIHGKPIESILINSDQTVWDPKKHPSGIYFYQIFTEEQILQTGKLLLNK